MASFAAGKTDILVFITVIKVGVNIPNASLMVTENADARARFRALCATTDSIQIA